MIIASESEQYSASIQAGIAALDAMSEGVMLVDGAARLCFANAAAERILERGDGIIVHRGKLCAQRNGQTEALRDLVACACGVGENPSPGIGGEIAIGRPSGRRDLLVSITPIGRTGKSASASQFAATITITDPEDRPAPRQAILETLFGLTPAEARLAAEMATGDSLERVAARLDLTRESARTTLKRVYSKTDTHRQAELVRLLLSVPWISRRGG